MLEELPKEKLCLNCFPRFRSKSDYDIETYEVELSNNFKSNLKGEFGEQTTDEVKRNIFDSIIDLGEDWEKKPFRYFTPKIIGEEKYVDKDAHTISKETLEKTRFFSYSDELVQESSKILPFSHNTVDRVIFYVKSTGETKKVDYIMKKHRNFEERETETVELKPNLEIIEDFHIYYLEIKATSTKGFARNLSKVQKNILQEVRNSEHADFYIARINLKNLDFKLPDNVPVEVKKTG